MSSIVDQLVNTARDVLLSFGETFVRMVRATANALEAVVGISPEAALFGATSVVALIVIIRLID